MKKDCTKPCFSNGSECSGWMDRNCDNCVKGSRYNAKKDTYTKIRCTIQEDIFTQYLGYGSDAIRQKSYDATLHVDCPYIVRLGTPRKVCKRINVSLQQVILFDNN